jgi:4-hydroxybenzoate polyprenyltransferase
MTASFLRPIKPWLELIRFPNLFSVPGDPLAGMAFAAPLGAVWAPMPVVSAIAIALLLYMAGLILNDLMDYEEDLADRPERPLPSGKVPVPVAWALFAGTTAGAIGLAAATGRKSPVFMTVLLLLCICLYNLGLKNVRILGPVSMGLCRGCSMLLGAAMIAEKMSDFEPLIYAVHTVIIYIALLTLIADYETRPRAPVGVVWLPTVIVLAGFVVVYLTQPGNPMPYWAAAAYAVYMNVRVALNIRKRQQVIPPDIGGMIGALMFMQAAWLYLNGALIAGTVIVLLFPFNRFVVRRIYAS